jgi:hypothetical protein
MDTNFPESRQQRRARQRQEEEQRLQQNAKNAKQTAVTNPINEEENTAKISSGDSASSLRRFLLNGLGLAILGIEGVWPRSVLDIFAFFSIPDGLRATGGAVMWSVTHLELWLPVAFGLAIIAYANWGAVRARLPEKLWTPWVIVLAILAASFFVPIGKNIYETATVATPEQPLREKVLPTTRLVNSPITGFPIGIQNEGCVNTELENSPIKDGAIAGIINHCPNDR